MVINITNNAVKLKLNSVAVDTNILLWTYYGNSAYSKTYQSKIYPNYLMQLIQDNKCEIFTTTNNILELFNVIEKTEYELYLKNNGISEKQLTRKQYRNLPIERKKLKDTYNLLYKQISQVIKIEVYNIEIPILVEYIDTFLEHNYDSFDFSLVKFCTEKGIKYILTDDADFGNNDMGVSILTANKNMLNESLPLTNMRYINSWFEMVNSPQQIVVVSFWARSRYIRR